jgi:hypothetical protein
MNFKRKRAKSSGPRKKARTSGRKYNAAARIQSVVRRALSRTIETKESCQTIGVTLRDAKTGIKDRYEPGM